MAEGCWYRSGGILGLIELLDDEKKGRAIRSDLLDRGLRLRWLCDGIHDFNWRDLLDIVTESSRMSALYRALHPEDWYWSHEAMLLALVSDRLAILAWQKTENGRKGIKEPEPYPRPGIKPSVRTVKGSALPMDQFHARLKHLQSRGREIQPQQEIKVFKRTDG